MKKEPEKEEPEEQEPEEEDPYEGLEEILGDLITSWYPEGSLATNMQDLPAQFSRLYPSMLARLNPNQRLPNPSVVPIPIGNEQQDKSRAEILKIMTK
jgi:hypothetical protein